MLFVLNEPLMFLNGLFAWYGVVNVSVLRSLGCKGGNGWESVNGSNIVGSLDLGRLPEATRGRIVTSTIPGGLGLEPRFSTVTSSFTV